MKITEKTYKIDDKIIELLSDNNWHKAKEIRNFAGVKSPITLRIFIRRLRFYKEPIIANNCGYKLCNLKKVEDLKQLKRYLEKRENETKNEFEIIKDMWKLCSSNVEFCLVEKK